MKVKKLLAMSLVAAAILGSLGFGAKANAEEIDERVYISNSTLRMWANDTLENNGIVVENGLPTVGQLGSLTDRFDASVGDSNSYSLDGIQYMTNVKRLGMVMGGNVIDFRPLAGLTSVEEFNFSHSHGEPWGPVVDIDFVANWQNVRHFLFDRVVLDLSPLNEVDELNYIGVMGGLGTVGNKQAVSKESQELIMANPVTYSNHFENNVTVSGNEYEMNIEVKNSGELFVIKDIPENAESITIVISNQTIDWDNDRYYTHNVVYRIPVVWY